MRRNLQSKSDLFSYIEIGVSLESSSYPAVYLQIHKDTGKVYVGQSWDYQHRKRSYHIDNGYFGNAIRKYGLSAFETFLLPVVNQAQMDNLERLWIIALNATDRSLGYNIASGGKGGRLAEETKEKIRQKALGRIMSPEHRKIISEVNKGNQFRVGKPSWCKGMKGIGAGRKFTPEHKAKLSAALIGNTRSLGKIPWNKGLKYHNSRTLGATNG